MKAEEAYEVIVMPAGCRCLWRAYLWRLVGFIGGDVFVPFDSRIVSIVCRKTGATVWRKCELEPSDALPLVDLITKDLGRMGLEEFRQQYRL